MRNFACFRRCRRRRPPPARYSSDYHRAAHHFCCRCWRWQMAVSHEFEDLPRCLCYLLRRHLLAIVICFAMMNSTWWWRGNSRRIIWQIHTAMDEFHCKFHWESSTRRRVLRFAASCLPASSSFSYLLSFAAFSCSTLYLAAGSNHQQAPHRHNHNQIRQQAGLAELLLLLLVSMMQQAMTTMTLLNFQHFLISHCSACCSKSAHEIFYKLSTRDETDDDESSGWVCNMCVYGCWERGVGGFSIENVHSRQP